MLRNAELVLARSQFLAITGFVPDLARCLGTTMMIILLWAMLLAVVISAGYLARSMFDHIRSELRKP